MLPLRLERATPKAWHGLNLRCNPYFHEALDSRPGSQYPLDLFVGRDAEVACYVNGLLGAASSRQAILGRGGSGKTTLAQMVKQTAASEGYAVSWDAVNVGHADSTDVLALRILSAVYDAIMTFGGKRALLLEPMQVARQIVRSYRDRTVSGGANVSLPFIGGLSGSLGVQRVNGPGAIFTIVVPDILREIRDEAARLLGVRGIVLHLNNLENLADSGAARAAAALTDLRDSCLMASGYHWLLVGRGARHHASRAGSRGGLFAAAAVRVDDPRRRGSDAQGSLVVSQG